MAAKGKKKKGPKKGGAKQHQQHQQSGQKKDLSKIKCYACQAFGHYASQCPSKKKKKGQGQQTAASTEVDEFSVAFQREFSLYAGQMERERESL